MNHTCVVYEDWDSKEQERESVINTEKHVSKYDIPVEFTEEDIKEVIAKVLEECKEQRLRCRRIMYTDPYPLDTAKYMRSIVYRADRQKVKYIYI